MKLKCIKNVADFTSLPIAVGDVLKGVPVPGSQGLDIVDQNGLEWFVEPYLGGYAILTGGSAFTTMQELARFEKVADNTKNPLVLKS